MTDRIVNDRRAALPLIDALLAAEGVNRRVEIYEREAIEIDCVVDDGNRRLVSVPGDLAETVSGGVESAEEIVARNPGLRADRTQCCPLDPWVIRHGERCSGSVRVLPNHGDVLSLSHDVKTETLQRSNDSPPWRINGKLGH